MEGVRESFARTCRELADLIHTEPVLQPFQDVAAELLVDADAILADPHALPSLQRVKAVAESFMLGRPSPLRAQLPERDTSRASYGREVLKVLYRVRNPGPDCTPDEIELAQAFYDKWYYAFLPLWDTAAGSPLRYYGWEGPGRAPSYLPGPCTLRVWGISLEPAEIEAALGSSPGHVHFRAGFAVVWTLRSCLSQDAPMGDQVRQLLASLTPDLAVWERITSRFEADVFVSAMLPEVTSELTLDAELLTLLTTRHLSLRVETGVSPKAVQQGVERAAEHAKRFKRKR